MVNFKELASEYIEQGIPVIPVKDKAPHAGLGWQKLRDEAVFNPNFDSNWKECNGIGVLLGSPSGLLCLDIDILDDDPKLRPVRDELAKMLPPTYCGKIGNPKKLPSRFFRYNGEASQKFRSIDVEILAEGNQTVIPPSYNHISQTTYTWVNHSLLEVSIEDFPYLPDEVLAFLKRKNLEFKELERKMKKTKSVGVGAVAGAGPKTKGRCVSGSHNRLSSVGVKMFFDGKTKQEIIDRLIELDKEINSEADSLYFVCPSRKWKTKNINENATAFVEEIFYRNEGKEPLSDSNEKDSGGNYEQVGFYFRYRVVADDGRIKIVDVPQYNLMADWCFDSKSMCFDDSTSLRFDGKKWNWFSKTALHNFIIVENKECIKPAHLDNFVKMIRGRCLKDSLGIISPEAMVNVDNGIVDVKTGALLPHDYKYMFKYCAPVSFSPSAQCPTWEKFLLEVFQGNIELIDLAQRIFGYVLIGGRPFLHRAFVLYGSGQNGKSTFLDILKDVVGRESYSVVSLAKLDKEFSVVNIDGKLANIVEETPTEEINAEVFKNLVGGGEIQASHKGFDEYTFQCNARFVFACNEMPIFKDKTSGLEDRLVLLPFNRYFSPEERDTEILDKLRAELSGILNWALEGARVVLRDRKLPDYETTRESKDLYRMETDALYAWFCEEIEVSPMANDISVNEVYEKYRNDCEDNGNRPYSKDKFLKRFRNLLKVKCKELKITYEANLRDKTGVKRIFNVVIFKNNSTGLTGDLFQVSDKKRRDIY